VGLNSKAHKPAKLLILARFERLPVVRPPRTYASARRKRPARAGTITRWLGTKDISVVCGALYALVEEFARKPFNIPLGRGYSDRLPADGPLHRAMARFERAAELLFTWLTIIPALIFAVRAMTYSLQLTLVLQH
jgi:hypothetical protein